MMDTSETNIKICEKAEEIQKVFGESTDDVFVFVPKDWESGGYYPIYERQKPEGWYNFIWLPRQDQLQEMVSPRGHDSEGLNSLLGRFTYFVLHEYKDKNDMYACSYFPSMEQLWLAFMMKQKYNKVWNGKAWMEEKK